VFITAVGTDRNAPIENGLLLLDPHTIEEPGDIQIEAVCTQCSHARYIPRDLWRWS
jgi:hypothetical protein